MYTVLGIPCVDFTFRTTVFTVKRAPQGWPIYRDKAHTFGPWSSANNALADDNIDAMFRKALREAIEKLPR